MVGSDTFGDFVFVRMATLEKSHGAYGGEYPSEFVNFGYGVLNEECGFLRVESTR